MALLSPLIFSETPKLISAYTLSHIFENKIGKSIPAGEMGLKIFNDSIFIYDQVMGTVDLRKNKKLKYIKYENKIFKIKIFEDSLYWIGKDTTFVWIKNEE